MNTALKFAATLALLGLCLGANAQAGQKASMKHTTKMQHKEGRMRKHLTPKSVDKNMKVQNKAMRKGTTKGGRL